MRLLFNLILIPFVAFCALLLIAVYFFNNAHNYKGDIEQHLSKRTGLNVSIQSLRSSWEESSPQLLLEGLQLKDKRSGEVKGSLETLNASVSGSSLLKLYPVFSELHLEKPKLQIESLASGGVRVAGVLVKPIGHVTEELDDSFVSSKLIRKLQRWVLHQEKGSINDAEISWRYIDGKTEKITNISTDYFREHENRKVKLSGKGKNGSLSIETFLHGDVMSRNDWSADFKLLQGGVGAKNVVSSGIELTVVDGEGLLFIPKMQIERGLDVLRVIGRNTDYERLLLRLGLSGVIENARIKFKGSLLNFENWSIAGVAKNLSLDGMENYPKIKGVKAKLLVDQSGGIVDFNAGDTSLTWKKHFAERLEIERLSGKLQLKLNKKGAYQIALKEAELLNKDIHILNASATFNQGKGKDKFLVSMLPIADVKLSGLEKYFPKVTQAKFRDWWSNAIVSTESVNGYLSYSGSLSGEGLANSSDKATFNPNALLGRLNAKKIVFDYGFRRDWPVMLSDEVNFELRNKELTINSKQADFPSVKMMSTDVFASIPEIFQNGRVMTLGGNLSGELPDLVKFLQTGSLAKRKNRPEPKEFVVSSTGSYQGELSFTMPFKKVSNTTVSGFLDILDGSVTLPGEVEVTSLKGLVNYTDSTVDAQDLHASFLGGEIRANLSTIEPAQPPSVRISGAGNAVLSELKPWIGEALSSQIDGTSAWTGSVDITKDFVMVDVNTNLAGATIKLPEPLQKTADDFLPINLNLITGRAVKNHIDVKGENLRVKLQALTENSNSYLDNGQLLFGKAFDETKVGKEGISIGVSHSMVNIDDWIESITEMSQFKPEVVPVVSFVDQLKGIDIKTDNLVLFGKDLGQSNLALQSNNGQLWEGSINGENAEGMLSMQPAVESPIYDLKFEKLIWPHVETDAPHTDFNVSDLAADYRLPNEMPIVDLTAESFMALGKDLGKLTFMAAPEGESWKINQADFDIDGASVKAFGQWQPVAFNAEASRVTPEASPLTTAKRQTQTKLSLSLDAKKSGRVLTYLGLDDMLEGGRVELLVDSNWYGAPYDFALNRLSGNYDIKVNKGSFPSVDPSAGRLFGLMNINALSRRLRLDFSDVFQKGLVFDNLKATGDIFNGDMGVESFYIYSPAVYVQANGRVGLSKEDYDLEMVVSPQLGGNVALFSALANPTAGAIVFLAQRVFKQKLNDSLVYKYTVKGDWEQPEISQEETVASKLADEEFEDDVTND